MPAWLDIFGDPHHLIGGDISATMLASVLSWYCVSPLPPSDWLVFLIREATARRNDSRCPVSWGVSLPGREGEGIALDGTVRSP